MNSGKTSSARGMDFLTWKTFHRIVVRRGGDTWSRIPACAGKFRATANEPCAPPSILCAEQP